jgi:hypothetical protein
LAFTACIITLLGIVLFVRPRFSGGTPIQTKLLDAIRNTKQVVVVVHSSRCDYPQANEEAMRNYKEQIFQTVDLLPAQRESLLQALPRAKDISDSAQTTCIFVPHHRIEILKSDGSKLVWEICFQCGEHFVEGDRVRILPHGWAHCLKSFFQSQNIRTGVPPKTKANQADAPDAGLRSDHIEASGAPV